MTKILIVDDSLVDQSLIARIIQQATDWEVSLASNGKLALERIEDSVPDVVLTDLLMPEMDGLQLVAKLRKSHPELPVVLVTAHGSEDLAIQALREGASGYTPKKMLANSLVETVRGILAASAGIHNHKRLMTNLLDGSISWELENDSSLVVPFIEQVQSFVADWSESEQLRIRVAIDEAIINAMYHGNLEIDSGLRLEDEAKFDELARARSNTAPFADRRVHIKADFSPTHFSIVIRDEGPGYDPNRIADPTSPENIGRICGRGMLLIRSFMDQVTLNEQGNEISMVKRRVSFNGEYS